MAQLLVWTEPLSGSNCYLMGEEGGCLVVDPNDPEPCPCGGQGCLERLVCRRRMRERLQMHRTLRKITGRRTRIWKMYI